MIQAKTYCFQWLRCKKGVHQGMRKRQKHTVTCRVSKSLSPNIWSFPKCCCLPKLCTITAKAVWPILLASGSFEKHHDNIIWWGLFALCFCWVFCRVKGGVCYSYSKPLSLLYQDVHTQLCAIKKSTFIHTCSSSSITVRCRWQEDGGKKMNARF